MVIDRRQFIRLGAGAVAMRMVSIHAAGIDSRPAASKAMRKAPIITCTPTRLTRPSLRRWSTP
jgi:hypothetical protein